MLSDGTLCPKCDMTINQLLSQKKWWISDEEYTEVMKKSFKPRSEYTMPLEKAQDLIALDVIPAETSRLVKETFFSQLEANVHKHRIPEDDEGWIIIDTEEFQSIPVKGFAACYK